MTPTDRPTLDIDYHTGAFVSADLDERATAWNEVRGKCPVSWNERNGGHWILADYESVQMASRDAETFRHQYSTDPQDDLNYIGVVAVPRPEGLDKIIIGESDGPFHAGLRAGLNPLFTPSTARTYRDFFDSVVNWRIDQVIEGGEVEFIDDIIAPVTAIGTLHILGLPLEHWLMTSEVFHKVLGHIDDAEERRTVGDTLLPELMGILTAECLDRRANPQDDVITAIAQVEIEGQLLTDAELSQIIYNLVSGGVDTTTGFTGLVLKHMQTDRDTRTALIEKPELWSSATEEFLRLYGTVPSLARTVAADKEVGGQAIHRGEHVVIAHMAANRDPRQFDNPDDFIIDRKRNPHLSFGLSAHRCLGSHVARVVFQSITSAVLERMPDYEIDLANVVEYSGAPSVLGMWKLPGSFTPGRSLDTPSPVDAA